MFRDYVHVLLYRFVAVVIITVRTVLATVLNCTSRSNEGGYCTALLQCRTVQPLLQYFTVQYCICVTGHTVDAAIASWNEVQYSNLNPISLSETKTHIHYQARVKAKPYSRR